MAKKRSRDDVVAGWVEHARRVKWMLNILCGEADRLPELVDAHGDVLGNVRTRLRELMSDLCSYCNLARGADEGSPPGPARPDPHGRCGACGFPNKADGCCARVQCCNSD